MARIPEAEIERLMEAVPMERLIEASGIELKKGGKAARPLPVPRGRDG